MDLQAFYQGYSFDAYNYLGAHYADGKTTFRVFAPSAQNISVIGEFNGWNGTPMHRILDGNFFEVTIDNAKPNMMYKYRICGKDGRTLDRCDPYGGIIGRLRC